jgi:hypothetical protein
MNISIEDISNIIISLERDVKFLQRCNFMDYSLLLGIEEVNCNNKELFDSIED